MTLINSIYGQIDTIGGDDVYIDVVSDSLEPMHEDIVIDYFALIGTDFSGDVVVNSEIPIESLELADFDTFRCTVSLTNVPTGEYRLGEAPVVDISPTDSGFCHLQDPEPIIFGNSPLGIDPQDFDIDYAIDNGLREFLNLANTGTEPCNLNLNITGDEGFFVQEAFGGAVKNLYVSVSPDVIDLTAALFFAKIEGPRSGTITITGAQQVFEIPLSGTGTSSRCFDTVFESGFEVGEQACWESDE